MKKSDRITTTMFLFFSFRLIFATNQPSRHERTRMNTLVSRMSISPPTMRIAVSGMTIQPTMTAGSSTTAEYISPIRYTPSSRDVMIACGSMGSESSRSLSFARYSPE